MENYLITVVDGIITEIADPAEAQGPFRLFIPGNVTGIDEEAKLFVEPAEIVVENSSETFFVKDGCLITKDGELAMVAESFILPEDGSVKKLGQAFAAPCDMSGKGFDHFIVPESVTELGPHSLAIECDDPICITVPASVRKIGALAFCCHSAHKPVELIFEGSPEIEDILFGTKAECDNSTFGFLRCFLAGLCPEPESFHVICKSGSSIEEYCIRYGIPFKLK